MAKMYFNQLNNLLDELNLRETISGPLEVKHFFSGAALYINHKICVSLSPAGLAFKLADDKTLKLIDEGHAKPLKYFANGHIKKDYALFENPDLSERSKWKKYFMKASNQPQ